mgnify:CR=1 FL=1
MAPRERRLALDGLDRLGLVDLRRRQDRLRQQYVEGQISEAEFERRIGEELETEEVDEIDRELERER